MKRRSIAALAGSTLALPASAMADTPDGEWAFKALLGH